MTVSEIQQLVGPTFADTFHKEVEKVLAPLRKYIDQGRPPSMGKEIWEYLVTDSIADSIPDAVWCGAGKGIADVRIGDTASIDVKSLQQDGNQTSEASMYQKLLKDDTAGYYKGFDKESLWKLLVEGWIKKIKSVKQYYLLVIIRNKKTLQCSLIGFKVQDTGIKYDPDFFEATQASMKVNCLIDPELAQIKIYRGKTRMEIRFEKKLYADPAYSLPIYKGIK
jgi:hypothetical protein